MPTAVAAKLSQLKKGDTVRAKVALPKVPVGSIGKVIHVQGLSWTRYWVWFDNGERVGTIDRSKLMTPAEFERKLAGGDDDVETTSSSSAGSGTAASGAPALESVNGVPGHLIERAKLAREKWTAKKG